MLHSPAESLPCTGTVQICMQHMTAHCFAATSRCQLVALSYWKACCAVMKMAVDAFGNLPPCNILLF